MNNTMMQRREFSVGVIISTYNNPEFLKKTLWGYSTQSYKNFELIIADDGSKQDTFDLIQNFRYSNFPNIKHIWHPDEGFRKCKILNKALLEAESDYIIFTDQDCIPRFDFMENHITHAKQGYFLSGGYFRLPMEISQFITEQDIASGNIFKLKWLKQYGLKNSPKNLKLIQNKIFSSCMNFITPTKASWNGMNASGWKADMLAINGFNELMQYGGEDREFGERLVNSGIKGIQIRYSAICLHLDHIRPYKNEEQIRKNKEIRKFVKINKIVKTPHGIYVEK